MPFLEIYIRRFEIASSLTSFAPRNDGGGNNFDFYNDNWGLITVSSED